MNGAQHYKAAEVYLARAEDLLAIQDAEPAVAIGSVDLLLSVASIHSALAVAAATALAPSGLQPDGDAAWAWRQAVL